MKKIFTLLLILFAGFSQQLLAQEKCLSEIIFREEAARNPVVLQNRDDLDKFTSEYISRNGSVGHRSGSVRIIPVVFHVIHYGGAENISRAQIVDQIDSLNKDYRRLNADTAATPAAFQSIAADCNIEFRLAQLDPNGNCTDGVVRVYSPLTYNARNNVKALSYWPSDQYLNIWVVNTIANTNGGPGQVVGFAQFPGGAPATDGVVLKYDFVGSIGAAASTNNNGRTATHEVGHWLNLRHIWGDDAGSCAGSDLVNDTPNQADWTLSICPNFPRLDACTPASPGVLYSDYMDYTNGNCQNVFTEGQSARMDAALISGTSGRNNLYTSSNLILTGTDGSQPVVCSPRADFVPRPSFICEGATVTFKDLSWNGDIVSRQWYFPGGNPSTDTAANPVVTYATAGVYDVSLVVNNGAGTDSIHIPGRVVVSATVAPGSVPFAEGFENPNFPYNDWYLINANGGNGWQQTTAAASSGTHSLMLSNFSGNDKGPDEIILPSFNFSNVTGVAMTFDVAYAPMRSLAPSNDKLIMYYSTDCGRSWTARYTKVNNSLSTITADSLLSSFLPNSTQWRTETVPSLSNVVSGHADVRFRFEFSHDNGNNIYLDNININGTITGLDQLNAEYASVNVHPNPSHDVTYVDFSMLAAGTVRIDLNDISGRQISSYTNSFTAGDHQYTVADQLEPGVYLLRLSFGDHSITKRVVIN